MIVSYYEHYRTKKVVVIMNANSVAELPAGSLKRFEELIEDYYETQNAKMQGWV